MIDREELRQRVADRRREIDEREEKLLVLTGRISDFVSDVRQRSVIYNLIRNLPVWQELERLIAAASD